MKYKNPILLSILVLGFILSGILYVGITLYFEDKGYDNQTIKCIIASYIFIVALPIAILINIYYVLKYKK